MFCVCVFCSQNICIILSSAIYRSLKSLLYFVIWDYHIVFPYSRTQKELKSQMRHDSNLVICFNVCLFKFVSLKSRSEKQSTKEEIPVPLVLKTKPHHLVKGALSHKLGKFSAKWKCYGTHRIFGLTGWQHRIGSGTSVSYYSKKNCHWGIFQYLAIRDFWFFSCYERYCCLFTDDTRWNNFIFSPPQKKYVA